MRLRAVALVLVFATVARAEPPAAAPASDGEAGPLRRPATSQRRIAQVLGAASLVLVAGGSASFGAAIGLFRTYRDGCGARTACSAEDVAPGKAAQVAGWTLLGAGVATGLGALLFAWLDGRIAERANERAAGRVALAPSAGPTGAGLALVGEF